MNNLQKMIEILKLKISEAQNNERESYRVNARDNSNHWLGRMRAYEIALQEAELLLNAETQTTVKKPDA